MRFSGTAPGCDPEDLFSEIIPGGVMYRPFSGARMNQVSRLLQDKAKVPLLIACNLERGGSGGNGGLTDGTYVASPMGPPPPGTRCRSTIWAGGGPGGRGGRHQLDL